MGTELIPATVTVETEDGWSDSCPVQIAAERFRSAVGDLAVLLDDRPQNPEAFTLTTYTGPVEAAIGSLVRVSWAAAVREGRPTAINDAANRLRDAITQQVQAGIDANAEAARAMAFRERSEGREFLIRLISLPVAELTRLGRMVKDWPSWRATYAHEEPEGDGLADHFRESGYLVEFAEMAESLILGAARAAGIVISPEELQEARKASGLFNEHAE